MLLTYSFIAHGIVLNRQFYFALIVLFGDSRDEVCGKILIQAEIVFVEVFHDAFPDVVGLADVNPRPPFALNLYQAIHTLLSCLDALCAFLGIWSWILCREWHIGYLAGGCDHLGAQVEYTDLASSVWGGALC